MPQCVSRKIAKVCIRYGRDIYLLRWLKRTEIFKFHWGHAACACFCVLQSNSNLAKSRKINGQPFGRAIKCPSCCLPSRNLFVFMFSLSFIYFNCACACVCVRWFSHMNKRNLFAQIINVTYVVNRTRFPKKLVDWLLIALWKWEYAEFSRNNSLVWWLKWSIKLTIYLVVCFIYFFRCVNISKPHSWLSPCVCA